MQRVHALNPSHHGPRPNAPVPGQLFDASALESVKFCKVIASLLNRPTLGEWHRNEAAPPGVLPQGTTRRKAWSARGGGRRSGVHAPVAAHAPLIPLFGVWTAELEFLPQEFEELEPDDNGHYAYAPANLHPLLFRRSDAVAGAWEWSDDGGQLWFACDNFREVGGWVGA